MNTTKYPEHDLDLPIPSLSVDYTLSRYPSIGL